MWKCMCEVLIQDWWIRNQLILGIECVSTVICLKVTPKTKINFVENLFA